MTGRTMRLPFFIIIPEPIKCPSRQNPPEISPSVTSTCPFCKNRIRLAALEERLTSFTVPLARSRLILHSPVYISSKNVPVPGPYSPSYTPRASESSAASTSCRLLGIPVCGAPVPAGFRRSTTTATTGSETSSRYRIYCCGISRISRAPPLAPRIAIAMQGSAACQST